MPEAPVEVAIAILHRQDQFLMQLRDNIPGIVYPGCWGFFGGHLEAGETPEVGLFRELQEEINYQPPQVSKFGLYASPQVIRHVYAAPLLVDLEDLELNEGWDLGLLSRDSIRQGYHYSPRAGRDCPLAAPHQQILRDFLSQTGVAVSQLG